MFRFCYLKHFHHLFDYSRPRIKILHLILQEEPLASHLAGIEGPAGLRPVGPLPSASRRLLHPFPQGPFLTEGFRLSLGRRFPFQIPQGVITALNHQAVQGNSLPLSSLFHLPKQFFREPEGFADILRPRNLEHCNHHAYCTAFHMYFLHLIFTPEIVLQGRPPSGRPDPLSGRPYKRTGHQRPFLRFVFI